MSDKKETTKLLSFMATFDGGLYVHDDRANAYFAMNMVKENLDYIEWVKSVLERVTSAKITDRPDYNTDGFTRKPQVRLQSNRHPALTAIRDRIYIDGKKVIDLHMLKLLDAEALAIMFMADGGSALDKRFKNPHCHISLSLKGFSEADNLAVSKAIYEKLAIRTTVRRHNQYFYLGVKTADILLFCDTVRPHIKPSFLYKLERIAPALDHYRTR